MRCLVPTVGPKSILAELLREKGHEVVELQVGEIVSVPTEIPEGTDWVAVASKNSVPELARALAARGDACRTVRIAAVGRKTAEALRAAGISVDFLPSVATGEALHAELSALAPSARIFDFKGYENRAVAIASKIDLSEFSDAYFTCASSVDRVLSQAVGMTRCHSIGPTTSAALRRRGITEILEASEPSLEALCVGSGVAAAGVKQEEKRQETGATKSCSAALVGLSASKQRSELGKFPQDPLA